MSRGCRPHTRFFFSYPPPFSNRGINVPETRECLYIKAFNGKKAGGVVIPQTRTFLVFLFICALLCCLPAAVKADTPLPCKFFGSVTLYGSPAPPGTVITAMIDGNVRGSIVTNERGMYGSDCMFGEKLVVQPLEGDLAGEDLVMITFSVNGQRADDTSLYYPGVTRWLELTASRIPTPTATPTPGPAFTPAPTPTATPGIPPVPAADFNCTPDSGSAPLVVSFTDLSGQNATSWSWDFGDGNTSEERDPVHLYRYPGNYTVNFTVVSGAGTASTSRPGRVAVLAPALVSFPGENALPGDPDNDGFCEDINGNGRTDFDDVVLYFIHIDWIEGNITQNPFDYNQNRRIDFDDLFCLFQEV